MSFHKFEVGQVVYQAYVYTGTNDLRSYKVVHVNPDGTVHAVDQQVGTLEKLWDHKDYFLTEKSAWLSMRERFQELVDSKKKALEVGETVLADIDATIARLT